MNPAMKYISFWLIALATISSAFAQDGGLSQGVDAGSKRQRKCQLIPFALGTDSENTRSANNIYYREGDYQQDLAYLSEYLLTEDADFDHCLMLIFELPDYSEVVIADLSRMKDKKGETYFGGFVSHRMREADKKSSPNCAQLKSQKLLDRLGCYRGPSYQNVQGMWPNDPSFENAVGSSLDYVLQIYASSDRGADKFIETAGLAQGLAQLEAGIYAPFGRLKRVLIKASGYREDFTQSLFWSQTGKPDAESLEIVRASDFLQQRDLLFNEVYNGSSIVKRSTFQRPRFIYGHSYLIARLREDMAKAGFYYENDAWKAKEQADAGTSQ